LLLIVVSVALACGGLPEGPATPLAAVAPVAVADATEDAGTAGPATPREIALEPEPPAPPTLAMHRFAALVPGEQASLYDVGSRLILRAGNRLFTLSPGAMHRERELERALSRQGQLWFGAIGGDYPDALVADELVHPAGKDLPRRRYVRLRHGRAVEIAQAQDDPWHAEANLAYQLVALPSGRFLAVLPIYSFEAGTLQWLDFVAGPKGALEEALAGPGNGTGPSPSFIHGDDGALTMARIDYEKEVPLVTWPKGAGTPTRATVSIQEGERAKAHFRTTGGATLLVSDKAVYTAQADGSWRREEVLGDVTDAWPLPDGGALLATSQGPLVRDARGATARASWPRVTIEGRSLEARLAYAQSTKAAGFWAIAADGLGLFHDRAPTEVMDAGRADAARHGRPE
jgi:hypothetical protein